MLRFWRKDIRSWRQSLMFGAGHAGIEAILVGVLAFIAFLQLFLYRQIDPQAITGLAEGEQLAYLRETITTYWASDWWGYLWGALERFSVIPIHLAATMMVYRSVKDRKFLWYLAAVLWHTLVDFFAVYASQTWSIPLTEGILFLTGDARLGDRLPVAGSSSAARGRYCLKLMKSSRRKWHRPRHRNNHSLLNDLEESRYD